MKHCIQLLLCISLLAIDTAAWCSDSPPRPNAVPAATAADYQQDAAKASAAGMAQAEKTETTVPASWLGYIAGGLGTLAGFAVLVAKFAPAAGPVADLLQAGRNGLWWLMTPKRELDYEERQAALARGMEATVRVIQTVPGLGVLKDKMAKRLPAETLDHVNSLIEALEAQGVAPPAPADDHA